MVVAEILVISVIVAIVAYAACVAVVFYKNKKREKRINISSVSFVGVALLCVILLQTAYSIITPVAGDDAGSSATVGRGVTQIFQYFTLDADYKDIVLAGSLFKIPFVGWCYKVLCVIFAVLAPLSAGFFIFSIIGHYIPSLKFHICNKRTRFIFTELNERSVTLAENIVRKRVECFTKKDKSGLTVYERKMLLSSEIVFTDAYADGDKEGRSELYERLKRIGALCLSRDVLSLKIRWLRRDRYKKAVYVLMSENEGTNVSSAMSLLTDKLSLWKRTGVHSGGKKQIRATDDAEFYVFSHDPDVNKIVADVREKGKNEAVDFSRVRVVSINEHRNLVYRLISDIEGVSNNQMPLYHAILDDKGKLSEEAKKLNIVLLGGGRIGKEFVKAAYWCGQIMKRIKNDGSHGMLKLNITVFARNAAELQSRLAFEMPLAFSREWRAHLGTIEFKTAEYATADINSSAENGVSFASQFSAYIRTMGTPHYVMVALGDDGLNLSAAEWFARYFEVNSKSAHKTPITFVVENDELIEAIRKDTTLLKKTFSKSELHPFGSLKHQFAYDNIFTGLLNRYAYEVDSKAHSTGKNMIEFLSDAYSLNSSTASVIHFQYAMISVSGDFLSKVEKDEYYKNVTYWSEHNRWCAYMISEGYKTPTFRQFITLFFKTQNGEISYDTGKKSNYLLHPCLVWASAKFTSDERLKEISDGLAKAMPAQRIIGICEEFANAHDEPSFAEFLNGVVPYEDLDLLDKISVFESYAKFLTKKGKEFKYTNYKDYDIDVIRYLYIKSGKEKLVPLISKLNAGGKDGDAAKAKAAMIIENIRAVSDKEVKPEGEDVLCDVRKDNKPEWFIDGDGAKASGKSYKYFKYESDGKTYYIRINKELSDE